MLSLLVRSWRWQFLMHFCIPTHIEAGVTQGWRGYVGDGGDLIGVDRFGASAPGKVVMREYGFTVEKLYERALKLLDRKRPSRHQRLAHLKKK